MMISSPRSSVRVGITELTQIEIWIKSIPDLIILLVYDKNFVKNLSGPFLKKCYCYHALTEHCPKLEVGGKDFCNNPLSIVIIFISTTFLWKNTYCQTILVLGWWIYDQMFKLEQKTTQKNWTDNFIGLCIRWMTKSQRLEKFFFLEKWYYHCCNTVEQELEKPRVRNKLLVHLTSLQSFSGRFARQKCMFKL